jgi:hypothetical protein
MFPKIVLCIFIQEINIATFHSSSHQNPIYILHAFTDEANYIVVNI